MQTLEIKASSFDSALARAYRLLTDTKWRVQLRSVEMNIEFRYIADFNNNFTYIFDCHKILDDDNRSE